MKPKPTGNKLRHIAGNVGRFFGYSHRSKADIARKEAESAAMVEEFGRLLDNIVRPPSGYDTQIHGRDIVEMMGKTGPNVLYDDVLLPFFMRAAGAQAAPRTVAAPRATGLNQN